MTEHEPTPPRRVPKGHDPEDDVTDNAADNAAFDDALQELPELDGDAGSEGHDLDGGEGGPTDLDDALRAEDEGEAEDAELLAEARIDTIHDLESASWETAEDEPVDADDELAEGEGESWSDDRVDESAFSEEELDRDPPTPEDQGEEGFDHELLDILQLQVGPEDARPEGPKSDEDEGDIPGLDAWRP